MSGWKTERRSSTSWLSQARVSRSTIARISSSGRTTALLPSALQPAMWTGSHRRLKRHSRTLGQASMMSYEDTTERGETMRRLNFLRDDPWDEVNDDLGIRVRWFGHPFGADMLGASLIELLPRAPDG